MKINFCIIVGMGLEVGGAGCGLKRRKFRSSVERTRDNRRRDTDNLIATGKPIYDALVTYGLVPDDTPRWMGKPEPIIEPKSVTGQGQMWITIEVAE